MSDFLLDLLYAAKKLSRNAGFTVIAILVISLGVGSTLAVFHVVDTSLLHPLPYPQSDRIVVLWGADRANPTDHKPLPLPDLRDFMQSKAFSDIGGVDLRQFSFALRGDTPEQIGAARVTPGIFEVLGSTTLIGHTFAAQPSQAGTAAIISHHIWQQRYGADPSIIGKAITLDGTTYTIVGVMPENFSFPIRYENQNIEVWMSEPILDDAAMRGLPLMFTMARLRPDTTLSEAQQRVDVIGSELAERFPKTHGNRTSFVLPLATDFAGRNRTELIVLLNTVALLMLIACTNVANLILARRSAQSREIGIRVAIGASRIHLIRQVLAEGLILTALGVGFGLVIGYGCERILAIAIQNQQSGSGISRVLSAPALGGMQISLNMLLFFIGLVAITFVLVGLAPMIELSRGKYLNTLQNTSRGAAGIQSGRVRTVLVIAQVGFSLVLLVGTGLMARTLVNLLNVDLGFKTERLLTFQLTLPATKYPTGPVRARFYQSLLDKAGRLPQADSAAVIGGLPLTNWLVIGVFMPEGMVLAPGEQPPVANVRPVSAGYFSTMGIPIQRGRVFAAQDEENPPREVVINSVLARKYWSDHDPVGQRMKIAPGPDSPWYTIIGVVGDVHQTTIDETTGPEYYLSYLESPARSMGLVIQTSAAASIVLEEVQRSIHELDADQPISHVASMQEIVHQAAAPQRIRIKWIGLVAGLALLLTVVGIFSLTSYLVTQRLPEIGIRMALGASPRDIFSNVLSQGLHLAFVGLLLGSVLTFVFARMTAELLYGVKPFDPLTFLGAVIAVLLTTLLACFLPALRAARLDPMDALRRD